MGLRRHWLPIAVVALLFAAPLPARAAVDVPAAQARLAAARALWNGQHVRDYSFRLTLSCMCVGRGRPVTQTVRAGRNVRPKLAPPGFRTFPSLFAMLDRHLSSPSGIAALHVVYDPRRGFPRRATLDLNADAVDDELSWTIDRFCVLRR